MKKMSDARDNLLYELKNRFEKIGLFVKSEKKDNKTRDAIWVDSDLVNEEELPVINSNSMSLHPDFSILLDKYDGWIEKINDDSGYWVFIKVKTIKNIQAKKKNPFNPALKKLSSL